MMHTKLTTKRKRKSTILQLVLIFPSLLVLIPLYMIIVNSIKLPSEAAKLGLSLPSKFHFENYLTVFADGNVITGYLNSILIGGLTVVVVITSASLAAFIIQRRNSRLTTYLYYLFIIGLVIPVSIVPTIKMLVGLNLHNTYIGMILYYSAVLMPFTIFLLTGYLKTVPIELDESAIIDGSSYIKLFFFIIFPIIRPALITSSLIIIINVWNDFMGPFYLLSDSSKWTVTVSVYNYIGRYGTNWNLVFADAVVVILPILILYFFLQNYIVDGMTAGAIKG